MRRPLAESSTGVDSLILPHSDVWFVKAYPRETTEAFLDDHVSAFAFLGGVPRSILYDNTTLAVAWILGDGTRRRTQAFTGRNPRTGEAVSISASTSPTFRAGKTLKDMRAGYGRCSTLLHKAPDAPNPDVPTPDQAASELSGLQFWADGLLTRQDRIDRS